MGGHMGGGGGHMGGFHGGHFGGGGGHFRGGNRVWGGNAWYGCPTVAYVVGECWPWGY